MNKIYFLLAIIVFPIFLFSQTWTVGPLNSDFLTIQLAIEDDDVENEHTLSVNTGTYGPIDLGEKGLIIEANNGATVIIDAASANIPCVKLISACETTTEIIGLSLIGSETSGGGGGIRLSTNRKLILDNCIISQNTATGNGGGIYCSYGDIEMNNCTIEDCTADDYGGGIYLGSGGSIVINESTISNCEALDYSGGGIYNDNRLSESINCQIIDSEIYNCTADDFGGALCSFKSSFDITGTVFYNNLSGNTGGAIQVSCMLSSSALEFFITKCLFYRNSASGNGGALHITSNNNFYSDTFYITYTTIANNESDQQEQGFNFASSLSDDIIVKDSIIRDISTTTNVDYEFCCLWTGAGAIGTNCFVDDPEFVDPDEDDYNLKWNSRCIDAGSIDGGGPEGGTDMGFYQIPHSKWVFTQNGNGIPVTYDWRSFPRLDEGVGDNTGGFIDAIAMFDKFEYPEEPGLIEVWYQIDETTEDPDLEGTWDDENDWYDWEPETSTDYICSTRGYKLKVTDPDDDIPLRVFGKVCLSNTDVPVDVSGDIDDWVGYFLPETQNAIDALGSTTLALLDKVQTKNWTAIKVKDTWGWPAFATLKYGEMVILSDDDQVSNFSFDWIDATRDEIEPYVRPVPTQFSYDENLDYMPIYMEFEETPIEIGVYVDGVCRGAEVVDTDSLFHLRAFVYEEEPGYELEFVHYFGRSETKVVNYTITNEPERTNSDNLITGNLGEWAFIRFGNPEEEEVLVVENSLTAYPNPFNPSVQISFTLENDGEVNLNIFNVKGQKVKSLLSNSQCQANNQIDQVWNGDNDLGNAVSGGIYFIRMEANERFRLRKWYY